MSEESTYSLPEILAIIFEHLAAISITDFHNVRLTCKKGLEVAFLPRLYKNMREDYESRPPSPLLRIISSLRLDLVPGSGPCANIRIDSWMMPNSDMDFRWCLSDGFDRDERYIGVWYQLRSWRDYHCRGERTWACVTFARGHFKDMYPAWGAFSIQKMLLFLSECEFIPASYSTELEARSDQKREIAGLPPCEPPRLLYGGTAKIWLDNRDRSDLRSFIDATPGIDDDLNHEATYRAILHEMSRSCGPIQEMIDEYDQY